MILYVYCSTEIVEYLTIEYLLGLAMEEFNIDCVYHIDGFILSNTHGTLMEIAYAHDTFVLDTCRHRVPYSATHAIFISKVADMELDPRVLKDTINRSIPFVTYAVPF